MLALAIDGVEEALARLDGFGAGLRRSLAAKAANLASALAEKVRGEKLSGEVLPARGGALRASIASMTIIEGDAVLASVGSYGDVKYAAIQEYGGKTSAHEIVPSKADVLAFMAGGAARFARRVEHPGSVVPERSYLRSSLAEMSDEILTEFAAAPLAAWEAP